jgi:hypothetical protein
MSQMRIVFALELLEQLSFDIVVMLVDRFHSFFSIFLNYLRVLFETKLRGKLFALSISKLVL